MALVRSKSAEFFPHKSMSSNTRRLQEALYTHLDDLEKSAFIEALSAYGMHKDIFELVNALRKILNTPVKRQLFPMVRKVIRQMDVDAFDLLTRGDKKSNTLPRPFLYTPHSADLNVLKKYRESPRSVDRHTVATAPQRRSERVTNHRKPVQALHRSGAGHSVGGATRRDYKHKILSKRSSNSRDELEGEIFEIDIGEPDSEEDGFGFTIRGGLEIGVGVYISSVDNGSCAQKRGLEVGDLILDANHISFRDISHEEAARIITAASRLQLTVSRVGRIPGSHTVLETYKWTDPKGRPVSPPLEGLGGGAGEDDGRRRSGSLMLTGSDERKVNIVVQKGHGLGLMVRGGREYGLGIFISGIDPYSLAENAGLKVGDQILDVNGRSFLDVTHAQAANHLKRSRHLIITVKDVGKIPFAKTTIDETGWIESTKVDSYAKSLSWSSRRSVSGSVTDLDTERRVLSNGPGTQLMLASHLGEDQQKELIHDQAKLLLNDTEHATLNYYLAEYEKKTINVQGLVQALFELLNTPAKFTLLSEIRTAIHPRDLDTFDQLMVSRDLEKSLNEAREMLAPDVISLGSYDSADIIAHETRKRTMFSQPKTVLRKPQWMDTLHFDEEPDLPAISYNLLGTSTRLSRSTPELSGRHANLYARSRSRSRSPNSAYTMMRSGHTRKGKVDDPSDDSGVEINGQSVYGATGETVPGESEYSTRYKSVRPKQFQGTHSRSLSHAQQKILTHLHGRNGMSRSQERSDTLSKQKPSTSQRSGRYSKSPSSDMPNSYHLVQHVAEVHRSDNEPWRSGSDDSPDVIVPRRPTSPESRPRNPSKSRGRRSRHNSEHLDRSRSKSKSKSRSGIHTNAYDFHGNRHHTDDPLTTDIEPPQHDVYLSSAPDGDLNNLDFSQNYKTLTLSLSTERLGASSSRGRSPGRNHRDSSKNSRKTFVSGDSSSSTIANSSRTHSTLTINGKVMSPNLSHLKTTVAVETLKVPRDTSMLPSSSPTTSSKDHHRSSEQQRHQERRGRSRSRSPKPPRSPKVSRSRSPQPQRRQIPPATSLFTSENTARKPASNHDLAHEHDEKRPTHESQCSDNRAQFQNQQQDYVHRDSQPNQKSKRAMFSAKKQAFSSPQHSISSGTSPQETSGIKSSKYKSPRRDKQNSKANVPLIRINSKTLPNADEASLRRSTHGRNDSDSNMEQPGQRTLERVTISDHLVDIDTALYNSSNNHNNNSFSSDMTDDNNIPGATYSRNTLRVPESSQPDVEQRLATVCQYQLAYARIS